MKNIVLFICIWMAIINAVFAILYSKNREHFITRFQIWVAAAIIMCQV